MCGTLFISTPPGCPAGAVMRAPREFIEQTLAELTSTPPKRLPFIAVVVVVAVVVVAESPLRASSGPRAPPPPSVSFE